MHWKLLMIHQKCNKANCFVYNVDHMITIGNTMCWSKINVKTIQSKTVTAKNRINSTLKLYKDQLIFVFFQLVVYLFDIGSDTKQAIEFWG